MGKAAEKRWETTTCLINSHKNGVADERRKETKCFYVIPFFMITWHHMCAKCLQRFLQGTIKEHRITLIFLCPSIPREFVPTAVSNKGNVNGWKNVWRKEITTCWIILRRCTTVKQLLGFSTYTRGRGNFEVTLTARKDIFYSGRAQSKHDEVSGQKIGTKVSRGQQHEIHDMTNTQLDILSVCFRLRRRPKDGCWKATNLDKNFREAFVFPSNGYSLLALPEKRTRESNRKGLVLFLSSAFLYIMKKQEGSQRRKRNHRSSGSVSLHLCLSQTAFRKAEAGPILEKKTSSLSWQTGYISIPH